MSSQKTRHLHEHNKVHPGIYLSRESWQRFEMALQIENFRRAEDNKPPVSRTAVIQAIVVKWSERRLEPDYTS